MRFETDAFIIHTRPYKETSLIVSFFTKEYGNVSAIAKGAKGKKSKFSGNLEPFRLMNIGSVSYTHLTLPTICSV